MIVFNIVNIITITSDIVVVVVIVVVVYAAVVVATASLTLLWNCPTNLYFVASSTIGTVLS